MSFLVQKFQFTFSSNLRSERHGPIITSDADIKVDFESFEFMKTEVCVVTTRINQASLFLNRQIESFGSKKYIYKVFEKESSCRENQPKILLLHVTRSSISKYKRRNKDTNSNEPIGVPISDFEEKRKDWDIVSLTGDELCLISEPTVDYRQYFSTTVSTNTFMPLGARSEFIL